MGGFADLLSALGLWLGGRKSSTPAPSTGPGCIEIGIRPGALLDVAVSAPRIDVAIRPNMALDLTVTVPQIGVSVQPGASITIDVWACS